MRKIPNRTQVQYEERHRRKALQGRQVPQNRNGLEPVLDLKGVYVDGEEEDGQDRKLENKPLVFPRRATILISMFLTSFVGMIVERVGYRPLRDAPRASAAITGLMIGIILETGNLALFGAQRVSFPSLVKTVTYNVGGVYITNQKIMIVAVSLGLAFALHQFIRRTKWGMAVRAMAFDYVVLPLMGVSINKIAALTFAIGSALAAAAGILFGVAYPVLDPYMGILFGWKAFVAAILGGRGSIFGATLAGFLLGFIEMFVPMIVPSTLRDFIAYSIVLLILAFRPHGFFGEPYSARLRL